MAFKNFFDEVFSETDWTKLKISGKIPKDIKGQLLRIGPGKFNVGEDKLNHWFDGFSHLFSIKFVNNNIYFKNKFLESYSYKKSVEENKNKGFMFATKPSGFSKFNLFRLLKCVLPQIPQKSDLEMDNCNVNIIQNKNKNFLALTETTQYVEFDKCLNTLQNYKFNRIFGQITTAHPQIDGKNMYNIIIEMNLISQHKVIKQNIKTEKRKVITRFLRLCPSYFHSLAQTKNYVVVVEQPYKLLFPAAVVFLPFSFFQNIKWFGKFMKTKIHIVRKSNGEKVKSFKVNPFFFFHTTNAYEENDTITLELPIFDNPQILKDFMIENLKKGGVSIYPPKYMRYSMNLKSGLVKEEKVADYTCELQRINEKYINKKHRFVYGIGNLKRNTKGNDIFKNIVKLDVLEHKKSLIFTKQNCYFGEPVFVENKNSKSEDDGILLCYGFDEKKEKNFLLGLNAKNFKEEFLAYFPVRITAGFHGGFVRN